MTSAFASGLLRFICTGAICTTFSLLCAQRLEGQAVPDTLPPILLVHGIWSGASTWDVRAGDLSGVGFRVFRTSTTTTNSIWSQSHVVEDYVDSVGINTESPVIAAHSMGGVVARTLITTMPADALITVGSPHHGHPSLNDAFGNPHFYGMALALATSAGAVFGNLYSHCGQYRNDGYGQEAAPCYTVSDFMFYTGTILGLISAANTLFISAASIEDMSPNSSFINSLNTSTHINAEQATSRIAVIAQLNPLERDYSFFRLFFDEMESNYLGEELKWFAWTIELDGWEIIDDAVFNSSDAWYWERFLGGWAVVISAWNLGELAQNYNNVIGGWPNDGFMPVDTQLMPSATSYLLFGVSHTEETTNQTFIEIVRDVGVSFRRN